MLILQVLRRRPMHGYVITELIQEASDEVLQIGEGSLYPALHKDGARGGITSERALSDRNRRFRYYRPKTMGERQLATEERNITG